MAVSRRDRDEARRQELLAEATRTPDENSELAALEQRSRSAQGTPSRPDNAGYVQPTPGADPNYQPDRGEGVRGPLVNATPTDASRRALRDQPETAAEQAEHVQPGVDRAEPGRPDDRGENLTPAAILRRQALMVQPTRTAAEDAELARLTDHRVADAAGMTYPDDRPHDPLHEGQQGRHDNERGQTFSDQSRDPNRPNDPLHGGEQARRDAAGNLAGDQRGHASGDGRVDLRRDGRPGYPVGYPERSVPVSDGRPVQDDRHRALLAKADRTPDEVAELAALEQARLVDPRSGPHYQDDARGTMGQPTTPAEMSADAARHGDEGFRRGVAGRPMTIAEMDAARMRGTPAERQIGDHNYPDNERGIADRPGRPMTITEAAAERARLGGRSSISAASPLNPDDEARRVALMARGADRNPSENADLSVLNERANYPRRGDVVGVVGGPGMPMVPRYAPPDTVVARDRALAVETRAAADAATAATDAATAVATAEAAHAAGTKDADAKGSAAEASMKRSAAMHDAAAKASASVTAAREYDRASTVAVEDSVNAQAARAAAANAMAAGTADAATLSIVADAANARATVSAGVADKAANDAEAAAMAADEALTMAREPAMAALSDEHRNAMGEMKEWTRREIALAYQGMSVESRRQQNP